MQHKNGVVEPIEGQDVVTVSTTPYGINPKFYTRQECLKLLKLRYGDHLKLELGGGKCRGPQGTIMKYPHATIGLDPMSDPFSDLYHDLEKGIPLPSETVDIIVSNQTLEHISDRVLLFNEMYRILKPSGEMQHCVPHWQSPYAAGDPTHAWPPFTETSFQYFCAKEDGTQFVDEFSDYGIRSMFTMRQDVRPRIDITVFMHKPEVFVRVHDDVYKQAQKYELEWWRNNPFNPQIEWSHYTAHFKEYLRRLTSIADVGSGPVPYFCSGAFEWEHAMAIDPLIDGYMEIEKFSGVRGERHFDTCGDISLVTDESLDAVFCLNTLDHVQDPGETLVELTRILKPKGYLFLFVDIGKKPDNLHPHKIEWKWLVNRLNGEFRILRFDIEKSWKFPNDVAYIVGIKRRHLDGKL